MRHAAVGSRFEVTLHGSRHAANCLEPASRNQCRSCRGETTRIRCRKSIPNMLDSEGPSGRGTPPPPAPYTITQPPYGMLGAGGGGGGGGS